MFIEPTITWVPSKFSVYIWLDTKIVFKKLEACPELLVLKSVVPGVETATLNSITGLTP